MLKVSSERGPWRKLAPICMGSRLGKVSPFKVSSALSMDGKWMSTLSKTVKPYVPKIPLARRPQTLSEPPPPKMEPTPSQFFMEDRAERLDKMRKLSAHLARKAKMEQVLQDSRNSILKPVYPYQPPKLVPGDVVELFGSGSLQDREISPGDFVEIRL